MPRYVIERNIPAAGSFTEQELQAISIQSCSVLSEMGPQIQWIHSYVTDDRIYCTYIAPNEEMVREHARKGGFPADRVMVVRAMIDPTTAEFSER
jgi:cell division inhibitor SulA